MHPPPDYHQFQLMYDQRLQHAASRRMARRLRRNARQAATRRATQAKRRRPSVLDTFGAPATQ